MAFRIDDVEPVLHLKDGLDIDRDYRSAHDAEVHLLRLNKVQNLPRDNVLKDPNLDWRSFDFDAGIKTVDDRLASTINAMSANLLDFRAAGGKLIQYHGLADPVVPPRESIDYYERVQAAEDPSKPPRADASADFYRLFLAPGLYHCQGGPGPNVLDVQGALERWVEDGVAPQTIGAIKYRDDKPAEGVESSRALCPYPKRAHYNGTGDPAEASSFSCVEAARYPSPLPAAAYLR
jgi:feruloyl esterase